MQIFSRYFRHLDLRIILSSCLVFLSLFVAVAQTAYDVKLQLHVGERLEVKRVDKGVSNTAVPLLGDQVVTTICTYHFTVSVLAINGENYLLQCDVDKLDLDVKGSKAASKKAFDAVVELLRPDEIVNKSILVEVTPYFNLVGVAKEKGSSSSSPAAKRIFSMLSDIFKPAYAERPVQLGETWSYREENGSLFHSHIAQVAGKEILVEGTIAVDAKEDKLRYKGEGTFDSRVDYQKGYLRSSHSNSQSKGKARVLLFNLTFTNTRQVSTQVLLR